MAGFYEYSNSGFIHVDEYLDQLSDYQLQKMVPFITYNSSNQEVYTPKLFKILFTPSKLHTHSCVDGQTRN